MHCGKKQENYARAACGRRAVLLFCPCMAHPPSPCDGTCRIDESSGWCLGCRRTLTEIADWPMLTPREKRAVLRGLEERGA